MCLDSRRKMIKVVFGLTNSHKIICDYDFYRIICRRDLKFGMLINFNLNQKFLIAYGKLQLFICQKYYCCTTVHFYQFERRSQSLFLLNELYLFLFRYSNRIYNIFFKHNFSILSNLLAPEAFFCHEHKQLKRSRKGLYKRVNY